VFGIFLLTQFVRTLPIELEEAARIDGASRLSILLRIVVPLSLPALATLAVIQFLWTWNVYPIARAAESKHRGGGAIPAREAGPMLAAAAGPC